jgi:hypothetical protein
MSDLDVRGRETIQDGGLYTMNMYVECKEYSSRQLQHLFVTL